MIQICDPCEDCIILPCCEQICNNRQVYTNKCENYLNFFSTYSQTKNIADTDGFKKEHEEIKSLLKTIYERNFKLMPHLSTSSSSTSSTRGVSISSSSICATATANPWDKKAARKMARKIANKIDESVLQSFLRKTKETFGFYEKRKI